MPKLKTYSEFVNEALIDAIKNPIKWKKIKNNAKKYQKAKVAQALNDVDNAKRLEKGSDTLSAKQKEVLTQANKAKNSALADTTTNIGQRMADLATTDGLKQVVKLAKTKSALAANQIVLKAADGEEAKRLKIKQTKLTGKATDAQKALADYESETSDDDTSGKEEKDAQIKALQKSRKPLIDANADEDDKAKRAGLRVKIEEINVKIAALEGDGEAEAKQALADAKEKLTKATEKAKGPAEETEETEETPTDKGKDSTTRPESGKNSKADIIKRFQDMLDKEEDPASPKAVKLKDKITSLQKESEERFMDPKFVSLLESELLELSNTLNEEIESIDEGMYTASQLTGMLIDDIRKGIRKGIQAPDAKELKELALKRLKMKRVNKVDIEDTINGWEKSLADARKDKMREEMFSFVKATKGKIPESFEYVAESVSQKFARLRSNL